MVSWYKLRVPEVSFLYKMHSKSVKWLGDICATQTESALKGDEKAKLSSLVEKTTTNNQLKSIENVIKEIAATMSTSNSTLKN